MKHSILITFLSFITLSSCSLDNNDVKQQVYKSYWHLINVSGGFSGVDNDFELNKIIWSFNEEENELTVTNTNTEDLEDGLDTGTYTYSVDEDDNKDLFLTINSNEFGNFTVSESQLIIDQNITTNGTGADGFIYTFKRVVIVEAGE